MANLLADQPSAYLNSAAHQPVHWHPWGDAAFAQARAADKPVLLDIGGKYRLEIYPLSLMSLIRSPAVTYETTFYPSAASAESSRRVVIDTGQARPGIDIGLRRVAGRRVTGTVVGPRFIPARQSDPGEIAPPIVPEGSHSRQRFSMTVTLEAGVTARNLESPSHRISIASFGGGGGQRVTLAAKQREILNRDFKLRWSVGGEEPEVGVLAWRDPGGSDPSGSGAGWGIRVRVVRCGGGSRYRPPVRASRSSHRMPRIDFASLISPASTIATASSSGT